MQFIRLGRMHEPPRGRDGAHDGSDRDRFDVSTVVAPKIEGRAQDVPAVRRGG